MEKRAMNEPDRDRQVEGGMDAGAAVAVFKQSFLETAGEAFYSPAMPRGRSAGCWGAASSLARSLAT